MAYYRRRQPTYRPRRKTGIRSLRPRKTAITKLASAVKRLQVSQRKTLNDYQLGYTSTIQVAQDYQYVVLNNIVGHNAIFSTDDKTEDFAVNKTRYISSGIDMTLDHSVLGSDELGNVGYTCFLVSLKDEIGSAFNPSTGALTLLPNFHYVRQAGMAMLNKNCFNIHKIKRINLGNNNEQLAFASANQYGSIKRWYMKTAPNVMMHNPIGDVADLACAKDPSKTYYVLLFNDNNSLDLQLPDWKVNVVSTYRH